MCLRWAEGSPRCIPFHVRAGQRWNVVTNEKHEMEGSPDNSGLGCAQCPGAFSMSRRTFGRRHRPTRPFVSTMPPGPPRTSAGARAGAALSCAGGLPRRADRDRDRESGMACPAPREKQNAPTGERLRVAFVGTGPLFERNHAERSYGAPTCLQLRGTGHPGTTPMHWGPHHLGWAGFQLTGASIQPSGQSPPAPKRLN